MSEFQIFLSLTSTFMAAMAHEGRLQNRSIDIAIGEALKFQAKGVSFGKEVEQAAYEYAHWVTNGGRPPAWLPAGFPLAAIG
jgi:hypothetical protein